MYDKGQGVLQDYEQAFYWYKKAADQGNADAQFNLGLMYYKGQGVLQDYEQAFQWFRKAAGQGGANAQFNIGLMYYEGQGILQDYEQAFLWFRKAAEQGDASAQNNSRWKIWLHLLLEKSMIRRRNSLLASMVPVLVMIVMSHIFCGWIKFGI